MVRLLDYFFKKEPKELLPDQKEVNDNLATAYVREGYKPGSWTEEDIRLAKVAGWTGIKHYAVGESENFPGGTYSGIDPKYGFRFYLPRMSSGWFVCHY